MLRTAGVASAIHSAATDHGKLMTLVVGKRQSLLIAGHDDEVYDKKLLVSQLSQILYASQVVLTL